MDEDIKKALALEVAKEITKTKTHIFENDPARLAVFAKNAYDIALKSINELVQKDKEKEEEEMNITELMNRAAEQPDDYSIHRF